MLVRRQQEDTWWFVAGSLGSPGLTFKGLAPAVEASQISQGSAFIAIGADFVMRGDLGFYKPKLDSIEVDMQVFTMLSLDDWLAVQIEWQAPLANIIERRKLLGLWAAQRGPVRPLLQIAALEGFSALSEAALGRLADHLMLKVPIGADLFDKLSLLIKHCCEWLSEEAIYHILRNRHLDPMLDSAAILSTEVSEVFGKDAPAVTKWAETKLQHHAALNTYQEKINNMAKKYLPKTSGSTPAKATTASASKKGLKPSEP
eukprot:8809279-Lingulodinium_polyedra.AAC.1